MDDRTRNQLLDVQEKWRARAAWKFADAKLEQDPMGRRLIEHGAVCLFNCMMDVRRVLGLGLPNDPLGEPPIAEVHKGGPEYSGGESQLATPPLPEHMQGDQPVIRVALLLAHKQGLGASFWARSALPSIEEIEAAFGPDLLKQARDLVGYRPSNFST